MKKIKTNREPIDNQKEIPIPNATSENSLLVAFLMDLEEITNISTIHG